ncbi:MAG TPA: DUF2203 family protein [Bacteroidetes bacterium]|nr:DUF2203 family protein [Bacteroidota bacterium]
MNHLKHFTPQEANNTLPLVKRIVKDILYTGQRIRSLSAYLKEDVENHPGLEDMMKQLELYFVELEDIGCYYKDWSFGIGLVDFPSFIDEKEVLLCWRSDEKNLSYYHDCQEGYAGRKPIPPEYLNGGK